MKTERRENSFLTVGWGPACLSVCPIQSRYFLVSKDYTLLTMGLGVLWLTMSLLSLALSKIHTEYIPGANCGLSKTIRMLDRDPTGDERSEGGIFVKKSVPEATAAGIWGLNQYYFRIQI